MRHLLIAGVIALSATAAHAQPSALPTAPLNLTFIKTASLQDAISVIAKLSGMTIEFDATVTEEMRGATLAEPIRLKNSTLEEAVAVLTSTNGLTYTVTGPKAIRVSKKP